MEKNDMEKNDMEKNDTEKNDTEKNDMEKNDTEKNDTEKNDTEKNDTEKKTNKVSLLKEIVNLIHKYDNTFFTIEQLESLYVKNYFFKNPVFYSCKRTCKMMKEEINNSEDLLPETQKADDIMSILQKLFNFYNGYQFIWCKYNVDYFGKKTLIKQSKPHDNDYFELILDIECDVYPYKQIKSLYTLLWERVKFLLPLIDIQVKLLDDSETVITKIINSETVKQIRIVPEDTINVKKCYFKESNLLKRFEDQAKKDEYLKPFSDKLNALPKYHPDRYDIKTLS